MTQKKKYKQTTLTITAQRRMTITSCIHIKIMGKTLRDHFHRSKRRRRKMPRLSKRWMKRWKGGKSTNLQNLSSESKTSCSPTSSDWINHRSTKDWVITLSWWNRGRRSLAAYLTCWSMEVPHLQTSVPPIKSSTSLYLNRDPCSINNLLNLWTCWTRKASQRARPPRV
jgi:hypothetical protein